MHKQVSGWTVNFGPNFPESPFLELKTRKPPPPPFRKTSDLGWPKFTPEYPPPHFGKTSDLGWPKFTPEYPPHFGKTSDLGWPKFTPEYPPLLEKLQIWDDQSLLWNTPPPCENFQRVQVREFQNTESYYMWRLYPTRITTSLFLFPKTGTGRWWVILYLLVQGSWKSFISVHHGKISF